MVLTINRLDKLAALRRVYVKQGMMVGTTSAYMALTAHRHLPGPIGSDSEVEVEGNQENNNGESDDKGDNEDVGPVSGPRVLLSVKLASQYGMLAYLVSRRSVLTISIQ